MDPAIIALFIPIIALMIPIVHMLIKHQQQMAMIVHGSGASRAEVEQMRTEIQELRSRLNQQALSIDNLESQSRSLPNQQVTNSY